MCHIRSDRQPWVRVGITLVVLVLASVPIAGWLCRGLYQRALLSHVHRLGGKVSYYGVSAPRCGAFDAILGTDIGEGRLIDLSDTEACDVDVRRILRIRSLRGLELSHTPVTDASLLQLSRCRGLEWLELDGTPITDSSISELRRLDRLSYLNVADTGISDAGIRQLRGLPIVSLDLSGNVISALGLAELRGLHVLSFLKLNRTALRDGDLKILTESAPQLRILHISQTDVTDSGMMYVASLEFIEEIDLSGTKVTSRGVDYLRSERPKTGITRAEGAWMSSGVRDE